jgi:hypothetical protein
VPFTRAPEADAQSNTAHASAAARKHFEYV